MGDFVAGAPMSARHDIRDCPCATCARQRKAKDLRSDAALRQKLKACGVQMPADGPSIVTIAREAAPEGARGGTHAGGGRPHRRTR